jgi:hypothetical protein
MKKAFVAVTAALLLSACETATPYQPLNAPAAHARGGYSEQQIETDRWRVEFSGNSLTSRQTVERYLLYRAAQLTVKQGYDWFDMVERHTEKQTSYYSDPDPFFAGWGGPYWGFYQPAYGWGYGYWGDGPFGGFGAPLDIEQVRQFTASVEIVMGHGAKPQGIRSAYDALSVITHLKGTITLPKSQ